MKPPRLLLRLLGAYVALFTVASALPGDVRTWAPFERPVVGVAQVTAALLVLAAGVLRRDGERLPWLCLGIGTLAWTAGDAYWLLVLDDAATVPVPSAADVGYLSFIPFAIAGLLALARSRTGRPLRSQVLDGATAGLAAGAISAALVLQSVVDDLGDDPASAVTNLSYVVGDIVLLTLAVATVAVRGWRLDRTWAAVLGAIAAFWIADSHYLVSVGAPGYVWPNLLESGWQVCIVLLAYAAWTPVRREPPAAATTRAVVLPLAFAAAGLLVLIVAALSSLNPLAVVLAGASLLAVFGRLALALRDNRRMLEHTAREARTDALTGLGNRRALVEALERVTADPGRGRTLVLFDLDGFKTYNDTFGHPAGDALLQRLGQKLERVLPDGAEAFRMGGDEFCVLVPAGPVPAKEVGRLCSLALSEAGDGFRITSSFGAVGIPDETTDATQALGVADERLYAAKASRRTSAGVQSSAVLLAALGIRDPELLQHLDGTGGLAEAVARRLGLSAEEVEDVRVAAELHDVGKLGIPDAILRKDGRLDEAEWAYMRRHTVIGERILMAAPALRRVARLVRSSHERWDGGGYPDRLAGEDVPVGARIVSACDAYDAMVSDRPYRGALPDAAAREELLRCAGTQFDPRVVAALLAVLGTPAAARCVPAPSA